MNSKFLSSKLTLLITASLLLLTLVPSIAPAIGHSRELNRGDSVQFSSHQLILENLKKNYNGCSTLITITNQGSYEANVVIYFYAYDDTKVCEDYRNIQPGASLNLCLAYEACLPDGYIGYAVILSDQPLEATATDICGGEVRFRGSVIECEVLIGSAYWIVEVEEMIFGPPIYTPIRVTWVAYPPMGDIDPSISEGDKVEVFGLYDVSTNTVSLNGSEDYYIIEIQAGQEIKFRGTALVYLTSFSATGWKVRVEQVISGPQISGEIPVWDYIFITHCNKGYVDPNIEAGDNVEVYGLYYSEAFAGFPEQVRICESDDYYIMKVEEKPRVKCWGTATCDEWYAPQAYGNYFVDLQVEGILQDPQGKLEVGEVYWVGYQDSHNFSWGDCVEVYGAYREGGIVVGGAYGSPEDYIKRCDDTTPPSITNISESNDPINRQGCPSPNTTTISAQITDSSGVAEAELYYRLNAGSWSYKTMSRESGNTYKAIIGPFSEAGTVQHYIRAIDNFGNESCSPTYTVTVNDCELGTLTRLDLDYHGTDPSSGESDGDDQHYLSARPGEQFNLYFFYSEGNAGNYYIIRVYPEWDKDNYIANSDNDETLSEVGWEANGRRFDAETYTVPSQTGSYKIRVLYNGSTTPPTWSSYDRLLGEYVISVAEGKDLPDLLITDLYWIPEEPALQESVKFYVTVKNRGQVPCSGFDVKFALGQVFEQTKRVEGLDPGNSMTLCFCYDPDEGKNEISRGVVGAWVDSSSEITESDEDNNFKEKILADCIGKIVKRVKQGENLEWEKFYVYGLCDYISPPGFFHIVSNLPEEQKYLDEGYYPGIYVSKVGAIPTPEEGELTIYQANFHHGGVIGRYLSPFAVGGSLQPKDFVPLKNVSINHPIGVFSTEGIVIDNQKTSGFNFIKLAVGTPTNIYSVWIKSSINEKHPVNGSLVFVRGALGWSSAIHAYYIEPHEIQMVWGFYDQTVLTISCPVNTTIVDQYGRIIADDGTNQIPNADMIITNDTKIFYLPADLTYSTEIEAYDTGTFSFTRVSPIRDDISITKFENIPVTASTKACVKIEPNVTNYMMSIDYDGDGEIDSTRPPDSITIVKLKPYTVYLPLIKKNYPSGPQPTPQTNRVLFDEADSEWVSIEGNYREFADIKVQWICSRAHHDTANHLQRP